MGSPHTETEKERMRAQWRDRAPMWDRQADIIAEQADKLNLPLIEAVGVSPGQRVLDLASGTGEPALTTAALIGPSGHVTATDMVPEMLDGARRRAAARGLSNIAFEIADMEALPYDDSSFDRVTCRFGLMFCPDKPRAVAEALRVLRPGGRVGFLVWGPRADTTMFPILVAAAEAVFGPNHGVDLDTPFSLGETGALEALLLGGRAVDVEERELRAEPQVPVGEPFWLPQTDMTMGPQLADASEAERNAVQAAIADGFEAIRDGDVYPLKLHARLGLATKPEE